MQQTFSVEPGKTEDDWYLEKRHSLISDGTLRSENDKVNWLIQITHTHTQVFGDFVWFWSLLVTNLSRKYS